MIYNLRRKKGKHNLRFVLFKAQTIAMATAITNSTTTTAITIIITIRLEEGEGEGDGVGIFSSNLKPINIKEQNANRN